MLQDTCGGNPGTAGVGGWKSGIKLVQTKTWMWANTLAPSVNWNWAVCTPELLFPEHHGRGCSNWAANIWSESRVWDYFPRTLHSSVLKILLCYFFFLLQGRTLWVQKSSSPCCLKNILTFCRCHDFLLKREKCFFLYLLCKFQNPSILTVRYARLLKDENIGMDIFLNCLKFISFHVWTKVQSCVQSLYMKIMEYLPLFRIAFISWLWLLLKIFSVPQYEKWYFKFQ